MMMMINISRELCGRNWRWWMGTKFGDGTPRCTRPVNSPPFPTWNRVSNTLILQPNRGLKSGDVRDKKQRRDRISSSIRPAAFDLECFWPGLRWQDLICISLRSRRNYANSYMAAAPSTRCDVSTVRRQIPSFP